MLKQINPVSDIKIYYIGESFMRSAGKIVSLVYSDWGEAHLICFNQAEDAVTIIHKYGHI